MQGTMIALELKSTSIILLVLTCQISCEDDESQNVYKEFSNLVKQLTAKVDDQRDERSYKFNSITATSLSEELWVSSSHFWRIHSYINQGDIIRSDAKTLLLKYKPSPPSKSWYDDEYILRGEYTAPRDTSTSVPINKTPGDGETITLGEIPADFV